MVKSNVHAARRRRTNQRIAREYDAIQQQAVRSYQTRSHEHRLAPVTDVTAWWSGVFRKTIRYLSSFFTGGFFGSSRVLGRLDLRSSGAERFGSFDPGRRRNAGAEQLRDWFPNLGRMTSTRDGRRV